MKKILTLAVVTTVLLGAQESVVKSDVNNTNISKTLINISTKRSKKRNFWQKLANRTDASIYTALGYDSNPFSTPSQTYIDYSTSTAPTITPVLKSGVFVPIKTRLKYEQYIMHHLYYDLHAKADARFFIDPTLINGNDHTLIAGGGMQYFFERLKRRKKSLRFGVYLKDHNEIYVDHDNGDDKNTRFDFTGTDISNRYQYSSHAYSLRYAEEYRHLNWSLRYLHENLDYATPLALTQLDQVYNRVDAKVGYTFNKRFILRGGYAFFRRDYIERESYGYDATQDRYKVIKGAIMHLSFHDIFVQSNLKLMKKLKAHVRYNYSKRFDEFEGYANSDYNKIALKLDYRILKNLRLKTDYSIAYRSYEKAVAYDRNLTQPDKYFLVNEATIEAKYKVSKWLFAGVDLRYTNQSTSDLRYQYDELVSALYIKAKY